MLAISGRTKLYGVVGFPIRHSLSPLIHNTLFNEFKLDAVYLTFEVLKENFENFFKGLKSINNFVGLNVTVPFKNIVFQYLDKKENELPVNTVLFKKNKSFGFNTDGYGFEKALLKNYPNFKFKNINVLVLGAGGASFSVIYSLLKKNVNKIFIANRTLENAFKLKSKFPKSKKIEIVQLQNDLLSKLNLDFDLIVNTTSVGLKNEKSLIKFVKTKKEAIAYDLIYNPPLTDFLKEAKKNGFKILNGLDMLIFQAFKAFEIWTDKKPDKFYEKVYNTLIKNL